MFKKSSIFALSIGVSLLGSTAANAIELDEATRTVALDSSGKTTVLTAEQVKRGKRLFGASCGSCHTGGITKTNPNIGLDPEGLSLATPNRNSVAGLVDYLKNPTTFDGLESIQKRTQVLPVQISSLKCVHYQKMIYLLSLVTFYYNQKLFLRNGVVVRFTTKANKKLYNFLIS
jgi:hypothetical protein